MTRLWLRDSIAAGKPMTLSRRIDAVLYRPLTYPLPVPAFRAKVLTHIESSAAWPNPRTIIRAHHMALPCTLNQTNPARP